MIQSIHYKNITISFSVEGTGRAVVLLHGFLESSIMWNEIKEELSVKNKVICIDLLGHGKTDDLGYIHTMEEMAEVVKAVLKQLKIRRVTLIGHSMGGYVALAFAEKYPNSIKGLCLLNSTSTADDNERKNNRLRAIKMAKTNYTSLVSMSVANLFALQTRENFATDIEICKTQALKTSVKTYIACAEGMRLRPNREHVLTLATFKKLFIIGTKDPVLNPKKLIKEATKTNSLVIELSGGHMLHIENKTNLIIALQKFIAKN